MIMGARTTRIAVFLGRFGEIPRAKVAHKGMVYFRNVQFFRILANLKRFNRERDNGS